MLDTEIEDLDEAATAEARPEFKIVCKQCQFHLTSSDYVIAVEGHHEHVQCNPHGNTFIFKCFSRVPGGLLSGEPTREYSWFTGYNWSFCHCQGCGQHIGWYFQNHHSDTFFGLIADKILLVQQGWVEKL